MSGKLGRGKSYVPSTLHGWHYVTFTMDFIDITFQAGQLVQIGTVVIGMANASEMMESPEFRIE
jgi:hypothetical protein